MGNRYTLGANARLKREQDIEALFRNGKALSVFPLKVIWRLVPGIACPPEIKAGFSAPKKKFKRATDRNRVKRLLRESWRLQQNELRDLIPDGYQLHVFLLFNDLNLPEYRSVFESVGRAILLLKNAIGHA